MDSPQRHHPIHSSSRTKYVGEDEKVRTLIAERYPFEGVDNYFTDSLIYQDSLENDENPYPEEANSSNEADTEPEKDECLGK